MSWSNSVADHKIPAVLRQKLNEITTNAVVEVPVRTQGGITKGKAGRCYWNANILSQTYGGETIYGWSICSYKEEGLEGLVLNGHAVWKNPEGELVDPTHTGNRDNTLFLPYTNQLVMNGKMTEQIRDMYFCVSPQDFHHFFHHHTGIYYGSSSVVAGERKERDDETFCEEEFGQYRSKLIQVSVMSGEVLEIVGNGNLKHFDKSDQGKAEFSKVFAPVIREVTAESNLIYRINPNLDLYGALKDAILNRKSFLDSTWGYDLVSALNPSDNDSVWDSPNYGTTTLTGISTATGKSIFETQPKPELVASHHIPRSKKQRRKAEQIAAKNNLTPNEVVMLSNPYLYPHPYLVRKAGNAKVERLANNKV